MMRGTPAMTITFSIMKPGAREMALSIRLAPSGMRAMRSRAGVSSVGVKRLRIAATASGSVTTGTAKALAMASVVTSSWVGPIPPVANT